MQFCIRCKETDMCCVFVILYAANMWDKKSQMQIIFFEKDKQAKTNKPKHQYLLMIWLVIILCDAFYFSNL
jgi:hypothetical protein